VKARSAFESASMNDSGFQSVPFSFLHSYDYVSVGERQAVTWLDVLEKVRVVHGDDVSGAYIAFDG
jgi:hypothetical protein